MSIESFTKRFNKGERFVPVKTRGFKSNGNKNVETEQICIFHSLEVLSFGCNPASTVNSKTPVRLSKGVRTGSIPHQRFSR